MKNETGHRVIDRGGSKLGEGDVVYTFGQMQYLTGNGNTEDGLFFYHGNHLSSTQVITDVHANISQAVLYTTWGSVIKEYKADWMLDTIPRYLFNAKEKDEESGLYYYEARYYSDENIMFIARDPLFEKYFWLSPYAYCANNPVVMIDPKGEEVEIICPISGDKYLYTPGMVAPEGSSKFVSDAIKGLNFLHDNPEGDNNRVASITESDIVVSIKQQSSGSSMYSGTEIAIQWNNQDADIYDGGSQSPIVGLAHEIDHASISVKGWEGIYSYEDGKTNDMNAYMESVENAYMQSDNPKKNSWENSAMSYENFIGGLSVDGKKLSTYNRTEYIPPKKQVKVDSIFSTGK